MANQDFLPGASIAVIGAGIVGVASAHALSCQGYHVTVYDPAATGEAGSSRANAGHLGISDMYPLSTPGIHWKALKMLMNHDGALKIPIRDATRHIPWFWQFWRTSQGQRFEAATRALSYLCSRTLTDTRAMLAAAGMNDMLMQCGGAFVYDTQKSFIASKTLWAGKNAQGFDSEEMDAQRIAQDIPGIAEHFRYAVLSRKWSMVRDPLELVRQLAQATVANGVTFQRRRVHNLVAALNSVTLETDKGRSQHDLVIVAAGVQFRYVCQILWRPAPCGGRTWLQSDHPDPHHYAEFTPHFCRSWHCSNALELWAAYRWLGRICPTQPPCQSKPLPIHSPNC